MKKKIIIGAVIVAVVAVFVGLAVRNSVSGGNAYEVEVQKVEPGSISSYVTANGVIEEIGKSEVIFESTLKVKDVLAEEGDQVKKGQKILDLDTKSLQSELEKLKANRTIQELSASSGATEAEVESARSAMDSAKRTYDDRLKTYNEDKEKYLASVISKSELEASEDAFIASQNAYNNAKNAYQVASDSSRITKLTAEQNLKITDISIGLLQDQLARTEEGMLSPTDGVLSAVNVEKGGYTTALTPAYKVTDPGKLQVRAEVKEYDVRTVAPGQKVRITGDAIDKNAEITGTVKSVAPAAKIKASATGSETVIEVIVSIDSKVESIRPGLNVTCDIYTVDKKSVIVIPMEAITYDKDGNKKVFVVDADKKVMSERQIETGINSDMSIEVLKGLKEGELLLPTIKPMYKDGAKVRIAEKEAK
jgi:RND family efflux transporter MFP subunit